ncbi:MAG: cell wall hydrolase [Alphaproteobacteria bacterium]|nr:cell wall hydrolase [Alphaproteobacteria bacterium]
MQLEFINASNAGTSLAHAVAAVVYAETGAKSLRVVEAMCSMIYNAAEHKTENVKRVIHDSKLFAHSKSDLNIDITNHGFQMCLRVARRMLHGNLQDACNHATKFHSADTIPDWAMSRGYVADIDDILFYA